MGNSLYHSTISSDYIYHYGIKGMKWGIRRTAEQLGHKIKDSLSRKKKKGSESDDSSESKKIKGSVTIKGTKKNPSTTKTSDESSVEERKQKVLASRSAKELYDNADLFTTQELQSAYNRLVLEKNIKNLAPKEVSRGQKMIEKYVKTANTVADILNSTNKVASNLNRFKNIVNSSSKNKDSKKNDSENKSSDKKTSNSGNKATNKTSDFGNKATNKTSSNNDSAVDADSYEVPKTKKKTSTQDKAKAARDFVYDVSDVYDDYTNPKNSNVQDGMDFVFELGDKVFNSDIYGLLGSGDDDRKKR